MESFILLALMIVFFYFFAIRPQQKKAKQDQEMRSSMKVGDQVVTIGGIRGRVDRITDDSFVLRTGNDEETRIEFLTQSLSYIVHPVEDANDREIASFTEEETEEDRNAEEAEETDVDDFFAEGEDVAE